MDHTESSPYCCVVTVFTEALPGNVQPRSLRCYCVTSSRARRIATTSTCHLTSPPLVQYDVMHRHGSLFTISPFPSNVFTCHNMKENHMIVCIFFFKRIPYEKYSWHISVYSWVTKISISSLNGTVEHRIFIMQVNNSHFVKN
jgi:hypothetical protein